MSGETPRMIFNREMYRVQSWEAMLAEIAAGEVPDTKAHLVSGFRLGVVGTLVDVCELVGNVPLPPSDIPLAMEIVSDNAADAIAGTGAQTVEVHYLDGNFADQSVILNTAGLTPVSLGASVTVLRVNSVHVMTAGSGGVAAGNIHVRAVVGGVIYNQVSAGGNMCLQAHYTVPAGYRAYIHNVDTGMASSNKNSIGRVLLRAKADWSTRSLTEVFLFEKIGLYQVGSLSKFVGQWYPPMCDIKMSAQLVEGAVPSAASGNFNAYLFKQP